MKEDENFARAGSALSRVGHEDSEGSARGRENIHANENNKSQDKSFFTIIIQMKIVCKRAKLQNDAIFKTYDVCLV